MYRKVHMLRESCSFYWSPLAPLLSRNQHSWHRLQAYCQCSWNQNLMGFQGLSAALKELLIFLVGRWLRLKNRVA